MGFLAIGVLTLTLATRFALGLDSTDGVWWPLFLIGGLTGLLGLAGVVGTVVRCVRPQRVVVSTAGLQVWRQPLIPWSAVTSIEPVQFYHRGIPVGTHVHVGWVSDSGPMLTVLPQSLALHPKSLLALLRTARPVSA